MKEYHNVRKDFKRNKVIVPDSAHGTNPASASVVGFESVAEKCTEKLKGKLISLVTDSQHLHQMP